MSHHEILISEATLTKITEYYSSIKQNGLEQAGAYFKAQLINHDLSTLDLATFTKLLIQSKIPKVFAESGVYHDQRDWTLREESILGDISVHMPVQFYNDGGHYNSFKNHSTPIEAYLAYIPGALLRSDRTGITADLKEVVVDGEIDQQRFNALYERRLLPELLMLRT